MLRRFLIKEFAIMFHSLESAAGEPLKHRTILISPSIKLNLPSPSFMRVLFAICLLTGVSLCYFSVFPGPKWLLNCSDCDHSLIQTSFRQFTGGGGIRRNQEEETNISHILFGIGGSAETWRHRRHYSELWWRPNITRGYVWLDAEPGNSSGDPWPANSPTYRVSSDTSRFRYTNADGSRSAVRMARIVKESFELGFENVRWFVMGDDDTVFFTENLVNVLHRYDYKQMYYIGGNSESVEQNEVHSYATAYGGGGFAISRPLAAELVKILDGCIDRYAAFYGSDAKIEGCMTEIGVPMTREPGFHQLDIRGSPYGLLSAHPLAPLVSLHHLEYLQPLFPLSDRVESVRRLIRSYELDPSRTVQHTVCYDPIRNWSISISWGYSIQIYPFLLTAKELSTPLQTFLTWGTWSRSPFTFNTRTFSLKPCERPTIFYVDGVEKTVDGKSTGSWYTRNHQQRRQCDQQNFDAVYQVKRFEVTAEILDPAIWDKAPRRQCCEVISGSEQRNDDVRMRIRGCHPWETVTPASIPFTK